MDDQYSKNYSHSHNTASKNKPTFILQLDNSSKSLITNDPPSTTSTAGVSLITLKTEPMPRKETDTAMLSERQLSSIVMESSASENQTTGMHENDNSNNKINYNNNHTLVERRRGTSLYLDPSFCSAAETISATTIIPDDKSLVTPLKKQQQKKHQYYQPKKSRHSILAQIERQNALLEKDPKSICIQSNELRGHYSTVQQLVSDYQPLLYSPPLSNNNSDDDDLSTGVGGDGGGDHWSDQQQHQQQQQQQQQQQIMDWAFWQAFIQDPIHVAKQKHLLSIKVVRTGIPSHARGLIWQAICQSDCLHLETAYGQLCRDRSQHERLIQRDISRTYPTIDMFKQENGPGQQAMYRILVAYSLYDAHVGYCQGLAFLVGPLLMNMTEPQAFCVFVRLMETYEMRSMFTLDMEGLQVRLYQFSCLLEEYLPNLASHLNKHSIHAAMYASQWFLTVFAYAFPMELVTRIYDILFVEGATETMMRVAIAMLQRSEHTILAETELEDLLDCVTTKKLCAPYAENWSDAILDAMALSNKITPSKLHQLEKQYTQQGQLEKKKTEQVLASRLGSFWRRKSTRSKKTTTSSLERSLSDGGAKSGNSISNKRRLGSKHNNSTRNSMQEVDGNYTSRPMMPPMPSTTIGSPSSSEPHQHDDVTEELLEALDQLRKEHSKTIDELFETRMDKKDVESERDALKMTIMELERRYQNSPAIPMDKSTTTTTTMAPIASTAFNTCDADTMSALSSPTSDTMFINFSPPSLPMPFVKSDGTLLTVENTQLPTSIIGSQQKQQQQLDSETPDNMITRTYSNESSNSDNSDGGFSDTLTTSYKTTTTVATDDDTEGDILRTELVRAKVEHFESQQQCERLAHEVDDLQARLDMVNEGQLALVDKLLAMKSDMDELVLDKNRRQEKWMVLVQENTLLKSQAPSNVQCLMERIDALEASLAATKVRLAECESEKEQQQQMQKQQQQRMINKLRTDDDDSVVTDTADSNNGRIGRSASLYGRMWHVISPRSQTFRTS